MISSALGTPLCKTLKRKKGNQEKSREAHDPQEVSNKQNRKCQIVLGLNGLILSLRKAIHTTTNPV